MTIRHIFLDMDGVLVDFMTAALRLHAKPDALKSWPPGEWDAAGVIGISKHQFWRRIDEQGHTYWAELDPYPWSRELVDLVSSYAPFTILSSPSLDPDCPAGKVRWLQRHFHAGFRDFLIGPRKHHCARADTLLIDDSDHNIDTFRAHGGRGILFPRIWNSNHHISDPLNYVRQQLEQMSRERNDSRHSE